MKRTTTLGIAVMAVLFFTACKREESINIDQNRIYSNYTYEYNADNNRSTMTAVFRMDNSGGRKIELSYPARVDFNGEGLAWRGALGSYQLTTNGLMSGGRFNYHDLDDNTYTNDVSALSPTELPFGITSISRSGNFFLPWDGPALKAGETIRVRINAGTTRTFTTTMAGATHIILNQNQLAGLTPGNGTIQLERESYANLSSSNLAGGRITSTYKSRRVFINISN
ncbi:MAG: hypothetical protein NXI10_17285 [bacterium]|nr:hypothetical protein [bacterium]